MDFFFRTFFLSGASNRISTTTIFFQFDLFKTKRTELFEVFSGSNGQVRAVRLAEFRFNKRKISFLQKFSTYLKHCNIGRLESQITAFEKLVGFLSFTPLDRLMVFRLWYMDFIISLYF